MPRRCHNLWVDRIIHWTYDLLFTVFGIILSSFFCRNYVVFLGARWHFSNPWWRNIRGKFAVSAHTLNVGAIVLSLHKFTLLYSGLTKPRTIPECIIYWVTADLGGDCVVSSITSPCRGISIMMRYKQQVRGHVLYAFVFDVGNFIWL